MDYWMNLALVDGKLGYLERRRGQLPGKTRTATRRKSRLAQPVYDHEAKFLEGLVSPSNAFSNSTRSSPVSATPTASRRALRAEFGQRGTA